MCFVYGREGGGGEYVGFLSKCLNCLFVMRKGGRGGRVFGWAGREGKGRGYCVSRDLEGFLGGTCIGLSWIGV